MKTKNVLIRVTSVVCLLVLLVSSMAGCGQTPASTTTTPSASATGEATPTAASETPNPYAEKLVFTMNAIDAERAGVDDEGNPDPTWEWLKEKFNFDIEWIPTTWANYYLDMPLVWFATGDSPDIMMVDVAPVRYPVFLQWVEDGNFKPWANYENYPNIKKAMDTASNGKRFILDGELYAFPSFIDSAKYNYVHAPGNIYRADWARDVGLYQEDNEYTWDEWYTLTMAVLKKYDDGTGKVGGFAVKEFHFPNAFPFNNGTLAADMYKYTKINGKWEWGTSTPEALEAVMMAKKLYDEGFIHKDQVLIKSQNDLRDRFAANLLFSTNTGALPSTTTIFANALANANPGIDLTKAIDIATVYPPGKDFMTFEKTSDHWTETAFASDLSDEKIKRWMDITEYMISEEGYYVRNFGRPGTDWEMVNGKPEAKWPLNADGSIKVPTGLTSAHSMQWAVRFGCSDTISLLSPLYPKWQRDLAERQYKITMKPNTVINPFPEDIKYFQAPDYNAVGTLERDSFTKALGLMTLPADKVEAEWKKYVEEQIPKVQPALDELNMLLK